MVKPIKKITLGEQIIKVMIDNIESGRWIPGSKLPNEIELAPQLCVSRNILRESLKILEAYGILESRIAKGTYVSLMAKKNISHYKFFEGLRENTSVEILLEARHAMEPDIAFWAAKRCTKEDLKKLKQLLEEPAQQNSDYFDENFAFHILLAKTGKNPLLERFITSIFEQLRNTSYNSINQHIDESLRKDRIHHHFEIYQAVCEKNAPLAKQLMHDHIFSRIDAIQNRYV